ncbi:ETC complex I subunit [Microbaculum marinum]|uniref:ETC complex I subunit n=1 Tax=Microbaculum marinum TaxID=1764581 RepID=A0AAW9RVM5_9HYPH
MPARIFKPAKTAMQSGTAKTHEWRLEFEQEVPRSLEPLMGYTSSADMKQQLRLNFPSKEAAIEYAERNGIPYTVFEPHEPKRRTLAYADNFRYNRLGQWTH